MSVYTRRLLAFFLALTLTVSCLVFTMSLPLLVNGAECGPSNPLQGLSKRFDQDRGVQQVCRTGSVPSSPVLSAYCCYRINLVLVVQDPLKKYVQTMPTLRSSCDFLLVGFPIAVLLGPRRKPGCGKILLCYFRCCPQSTCTICVRPLCTSSEPSRASCAITKPYTTSSRHIFVGCRFHVTAAWPFNDLTRIRKGCCPPRVIYEAKHVPSATTRGESLYARFVNIFIAIAWVRQYAAIFMLLCISLL